MEDKIHQKTSYRQKEIAKQFLFELDNHLEDLKNGRIEISYEIKEFAALLFINPNHLSDTIKMVLGKSPCKIYEEKLISACKELLLNTNNPISEVAQTFSFESSNFTKFFKRYTGFTPTGFKNEHFLNLLKQ